MHCYKCHQQCLCFVVVDHEVLSFLYIVIVPFVIEHACDGLSAHYDAARDTAWRVGRAAYFCMVPGHSTALSHPLSALGFGEGPKASQHALRPAQLCGGA